MTFLFYKMGVQSDGKVNIRTLLGIMRVQLGDQPFVIFLSLLLLLMH
jgi:hypothetical protein